ncbi:organoarsenical effux MFS transporter ArsJ [Dasania sp. GY-MA-18]|uniref:Organoarsenical effux MFS transporter ArsJ n=1 Tax=Dasania phycosphaerae TaxID=2950436 RepID=A0A9J6RHL3_9GAMM|nr:MULTISPECIES: organoarsenical effux MFS transporter ArsJ [Dasania]MCR8921332.1 organoarsenical effux MFS transporter ArsJ [Dasania sp. GY-MA-18]MCZ0863760.1 organoarsenical effux MFS transporter ArsJ [Dasania phycosphaerae]MCZ0867488.1 organoarsenical effux MFS transporter ArsJ [Dasania phycosphaerae]
MFKNLTALKQSNPALQQYLIITANYWAFTLTDGALRMLIVLHFHQLGYDALAIAFLFLFYEFFGVVTNLLGGWLGARFGLNKTMQAGLVLQIVALSMLLVPNGLLSVAWVMAAQALSGIAKDLNKMSAKSAIKQLIPSNAEAKLYQWVALLTGSKNSLKGVGFFLGAGLLAAFGFHQAILIMVCGLILVCLTSWFLLRKDLGRASYKPKFREIFSTSRAVNILSAARLCLFASRDVWFAVALPVYLASELAWNHWQAGAFIASWIIAYGIIQGLAPRLTGHKKNAAAPDGKAALTWASLLLLAPSLLALALTSQIAPQTLTIIGLMLFGFLFAINSSVHSFLIVHYAKADGASLDVGFYYMANALGRLLGTLASGYLYMQQGFIACLLASCALIICTALISLALPRHGH